MRLDEWFLNADERGNPHTVLDDRHTDGAAWTTGNEVRLLVHGTTYFAELLACLRGTRSGDLVLFTDWRGDPDERLDGPGTEIVQVLCELAERGVHVKGLVWRSHWDKAAMSGEENRSLADALNAAGAEVLLDMRVRPAGSHHQKFVVLRHPGRPELDTAFVGGIDLCHSRRDTAEHLGDPQTQQMAAVYGPTPAWHDAQVAIKGPAVGDVETVFRERWQDSTALNRQPIRRLHDRIARSDTQADPLPDRQPDPPRCGTHAVQLLRTYPSLLTRGFDFAPAGERSVARGYRKVLSRAQTLVYVEDQYLWSPEVADVFAQALRRAPNLHLMAVLPRHPDQDGRFSMAPNLVGREQALDAVRQAGGDRVTIYDIENHQGVPVYVHAKVCVVDDIWAAVGSDNFNRRSWTHDSELSCAVLDTEGSYAREVRTTLLREHLDRADAQDADLVDPLEAFAAVGHAAAGLEAWYVAGQPGQRPPGRLRPYDAPRLSALTKLWATPLYRLLWDPDGRPMSLRLRGRHAV